MENKYLAKPTSLDPNSHQSCQTFNLIPTLQFHHYLLFCCSYRGSGGVLRKCYKTHFSIDKDHFLWTRQRFVKTLIVKTGKTNYLITQLFQNVMHDQTNVRIEKIKTKWWFIPANNKMEIITGKLDHVRPRNKTCTTIRFNIASWVIKLWNGDIIIASVKLSAGSFNYHWEKKWLRMRSPS